jgi:hypothetical protein
MIVEQLGEDSRLIPRTVLEAALERVEGAIKKNAALNPDDFSSLSSKLEYLDLRDLQNVIVNNAIWARFEQVFRNKQALSTKFDQLAELRNGIRHARTDSLNDITRKEGEAALDWFEQVLKIR